MLEPTNYETDYSILLDGATPKFYSPKIIAQCDLVS